MPDDAWERIQTDLLGVMGRDVHQHWIAPLRLRGLAGSVAEVVAPSSFSGVWVERYYGDRILAAMQAAGLPVSGLRMLVDADADPGGPVHSTPSAPLERRDAGPRVERQPAHPGEAASAPLDSRFRFETFVVGKPNELAHAAARRVAEGGAVTFSPLFLYGGVGLGKTHLMHAIAWELRRRDPALNVVYLSADTFINRFVQALKERSMLEFKQLFRTVDVLMVDDVQFIAGKESTQEEFFHTFNALVEQNKQIILSADRAPGEIKDLEERISTRLASGLVADLHPTTYELRLGILEQKVSAHRERYREVEIAPGVLEFLAQRISSNVRVLEGALMRLYAYASLIGGRITLDLVHQCLIDLLKQSDRKITVEEIQRRVAEHYNIRLSDLVGAKRVRVVARPRQAAMYLCKRLTTRSLPDIGRRFGGRDHTTVMHAIKRIDGLMAIDSQLADDIEMLRRSLEG